MIIEGLLIVCGLLLTAIGLTRPVTAGEIRIDENILPVTLILCGVILICMATYMVIT